jgi:hypothetical protein
MVRHSGCRREVDGEAGGTAKHLTGLVDGDTAGEMVGLEGGWGEPL